MGTVRYTVANGEIVSEVRGGVRKDYVPDALGSTVALLDNTQSVTDSWEYWPYGELRSGSSATPFQFVGTLGYYKDTSRRTYVRARHYRQNLGRWATVDPLWPSSRAYEYATNCPTSRVDSTGLIVEICVRPLEHPIPEDVPWAHWFINTSRCGAFGYGPYGGIEPGWDWNAGGKKVNCYRINTTSAQEECICKAKTSGYAGGSEWLGGGVPHGFYEGGYYHALRHNCQDFVQTVLSDCLGKQLPWPETPGGRNLSCPRKLVTTKPSCPRRPPNLFPDIPPEYGPPLPGYPKGRRSGGAWVEG